jgi:glycosyltransferase involved in cell wall biosynthesis
MRISIVTISFNQAEFLRLAIDSIVRQGYPSLEYIVVDPGSSDGSRDVICEYGKYIRKSILEPDSGPADGLNRGFALSSGDILGFVNADDLLLPGSLQFVSDYFQKNPEVDVLLGCGQLVDEVGSVLRHIVPSRFSLRHLAFGRFEFIQQAVFFRRSIYELTGGFNPENRISWDGELLLDMAICGARFGRTGKELGAFRLYPSTISSSKNYMQNLSVERDRLFYRIMGRKHHWSDRIRGSALLASKWLLDPWYAGFKLTRNLCHHTPALSSKHILQNYIKPFLRLPLFKVRLGMAYAKALIPLQTGQGNIEKMAFIIGCGRSGTTILGDILSLHRDVHYYFEPWHLWRVVDERTDVLNLFGRKDSHIIMDAEFNTPATQCRFRRLFGWGLWKDKIILEKTPHNAMRIGYLEAIAPNAKYIHIVRDGVDVALSVKYLIHRNPWKLAFRKQYNIWWGEGDNKWRMLKEDGISAGYFPFEVGRLSSDVEKAAYEWLVSIAEIDKYRQQLGGRFFEIRYSDLLESPAQALEDICDFLGCSKDRRWMNKSALMLRLPKTNASKTINLPENMSEAFNRYQVRYGFAGRAIPLIR